MAVLIRTTAEGILSGRNDGSFCLQTTTVCSTLSSVISSFPPRVFQNNSAMTIDAEQSCGKITVIKRELQAKRSLLCFKEHTHRCTSTQTFKLVHTQARIQRRKQLKVGRRVLFRCKLCPLHENFSGNQTA